MPDDIEIRPVLPAEYEAAGSVTALAYQEYAPGRSPVWHEYLAMIADVAGRAPRTTVLVALHEGVIAGSATLELDGRVNPEFATPLEPDEAHLRMLGVGPEHRGLGIARRLMVACMEIARERGKRRLTLETSTAMTAARRLYFELGFTPASEMRTPDGVLLQGFTRDLDGDARS